jgi:hypothetical protein
MSFFETSAPAGAGHLVIPILVACGPSLKTISNQCKLVPQPQHGGSVFEVQSAKALKT